MNWIVNIYKDDRGSLTSYSRAFKDEDDAYDFFELEIKDEFLYEIQQGLVTDQEIQNIISNNMYRYEDDNKEIEISIAEVNEKD